MKKLMTMMMLFVLSLLLSGVTTTYTIHVTTTLTPPTGHVHHFMRPSGHDTNCNGTVNADDSAGVRPNCAWATPNHAISCGDVIIAAAGTYTGGKFVRTMNTPTNCPSTTGGIDGTGGIWFAIVLCGAADLRSCKIADPGYGNAAVEWYGGAKYWSVQGFAIENVSNRNGFSVRIAGDLSGGFSSHHIAIINNVIYNSWQAIGVNDGGGQQGLNPPALDYFAAVGNISQNGALNPICLGAIDPVGTGATDSNTTAIKGFIAGNFSFHNWNASCNTKYDTESFMFDSLDVHGSNGIWTMYNNVSYHAARAGMQLTWPGLTTVPFTVNFINNTLFADMADPGVSGNGLPSLVGEINLSAASGYHPLPVTVNIQNNIIKTAWRTFANGAGKPQIFAIAVDGNDNGSTYSTFPLTIGGAGTENIILGKATGCSYGSCNSTFAIDRNDRSSDFGTNYYEDPLFANENDLLTNHIGPPDCTGFENVVQCMGWDARTGTLTANSKIADLTANCAHCAGKGYQRPTMTCPATNSNFPPWLRGVIYLHWTGTQVEQRAGLLAGVPCGM